MSVLYADTPHAMQYPIRIQAPLDTLSYLNIGPECDMNPVRTPVLQCSNALVSDTSYGNEADHCAEYSPHAVGA